MGAGSLVSSQTAVLAMAYSCTCKAIRTVQTQAGTGREAATCDHSLRHVHTLRPACIIAPSCTIAPSMHHCAQNASLLPPASLLRPAPHLDFLLLPPAGGPLLGICAPDKYEAR